MLKIEVEVVAERVEIEGAITKILVSKEWDEMRKKAMEIRAKVQVAVSVGGSSQYSLEIRAKVQVRLISIKI